ncbi:hypothetical protein BuS5_02733 [Desulfosarcina sp. BuS5]|uniref:hypothetical protein n=1 Tax=Desulfosarcina sp. BuS5 TaxID=933262 RepID=UPI000488194F|nr:hypothetical protein [Desulfosarcina sp. BuS5]WDN87885.1 hypothetical protein BuS5_00853 [Desulfosarcina sp. BuS5]WDN89765.1 hypothetical protein BuS5_02733 [Desulfosarcina sp. BuS5]
MMLVQQIKKEIAELPEVQLKEFRSWFEKFDASEWDRQFEKDVASGELDGIANKAVSDFMKGNFKKL